MHFEVIGIPFGVDWPKNEKQIAGDIIILHMLTKNHNHMRYSSWDTEWDKPNFLLFWSIFCPNNPQNQNFEKMKKTTGCHHFIYVYQKSWLYMLPEILSATNITFCHFGPFFALLPHYWPRKLKFGKNVNWRLYPFTCVYSQVR